MTKSLFTPPLCQCGHPKKSHRYGGANKHGSYTFISSCKKHDCGCRGYDPEEDD